MVDLQLDALAVGMRRAIYEMLLQRPRSVRDIAAELPISRPAVSQHLKVLVNADLARATSVGNRRVYSVDPAGMTALRQWVDQMWDMAMGSFAGFAQREMEETMSQSGAERIEPVVKTVTIPGEPGWVFELFTTRMGEWWPLGTHSVGGDDAVDVRVDPGVGGRVYEVTNDGVEHEWGRIVEWEPAARVAFSWRPGLPVEQATHVEITFRQIIDGTEVTLIHDGWEARGADWRKMRDNYDIGWDHVLSQIPGSAPKAVAHTG
ncbi:MAG: ArsR/SmtB family transcription factor [Acidimicrobiia bacterium]